MTDASGVNEVGPRILIGEQVIPCIAAHGNTSTCAVPAEPDAPNNMVTATQAWDTAGFGSDLPNALRDWRIYVVLDPDNEIPNETHELVDRFGDPLLGRTGQPLDGLEKGQNNTGWSSISIGQPLTSFLTQAGTGAPDVSIHPGGITVTEAETRERPADYVAGRTYTISMHVQSTGLDRRVSTARIVSLGPDGERRVLAGRLIWGLSAGGTKRVSVEWTPRQPGLYSLMTLAEEPSRDPVKGNAQARIEVRVQAPR